MSKAKQSLRIFALPLSKQCVTNSTGKGRAVLNTYYHFVTASPSEVVQGDPSLVSRAMDKVASVWAGWGKAAPGTWKVSTQAPRYTSRRLRRLVDQSVQLWRTSGRQARFRGTGTKEFRPFPRPENHQPPHCRNRCTAAAGTSIPSDLSLLSRS